MTPKFKKKKTMLQMKQEHEIHLRKADFWQNILVTLIIGLTIVSIVRSI
jgi:hypothetical protein